ncbi:hypothetical protein B0T11DRAFT_285933 [Plectosphaerella cucumerina]|uniref:Uncharacterized protein n=1 Tax=Plectosphaerella cucumerina TaxID=40658 RepID=A0A8K0TII5_9PEZI|nr:hypothetical protein B0T11DRAFT_285933 [Plectosphaerella cucumerina]
MPGRHAGEPVYLRPSLRLGTSDLGVDFDYVDGSGRNIPTNLLRLDDGMLMENAMAQVIIKFEKYESKRVNEWNLSLFVMWARKRLQLYLKPNHDDEDTTIAARLRHAIGAAEEEEHSKLEKLVSAADRFEEFKKIVAKVELGDVRVWRF